MPGSARCQQCSEFRSLVRFTAFDEPQADDALEGGDLLRHRRLRVAESLGSLPERALVRDRLQRDEVAEIETEPAISFHDRRLAAHHAS